jgi:hypothetical protein
MANYRNPVFEKPYFGRRLYYRRLETWLHGLYQHREPRPLRSYTVSSIFPANTTWHSPASNEGWPPPILTVQILISFLKGGVLMLARGRRSVSKSYLDQKSGRALSRVDGRSLDGVQLSCQGPCSFWEADALQGTHVVDHLRNQARLCPVRDFAGREARRISHPRFDPCPFLEIHRTSLGM